MLETKQTLSDSAQRKPLSWTENARNVVENCGFPSLFLVLWSVLHLHARTQGNLALQ